MPQDSLRKPQASSSYSFRWRHALLVLLVALVFRGLYLAEAGRQADFNIFYMDEEYNLGWARSLATGNWNAPYDQLRGAPYFRAPLYSYFLAGLVALFGSNLVAARIVQLLIGSVSCVLVYALATKVFGERPGLVAGLISALYWVLAYFDSQFLQPVLLVILLLGGLLAAFAAAERRSAGLAGLAGLAFGLYAVTRPEILVFLVFLVWWAAKAVPGMTGRSRRWFAALLALGFMLPPALATIRNGMVAGDWVVVASQGGVNFYIGNNPQSNGMQAVVPGTHESWWGGFEDTRGIAEQAAGRKLKASEVSAYWFRQGLAFMRREPLKWLGLTLKKAALFVGNVEIPNNEPYEVHRRNYLTLRLIPLGFGVLLALFAVGLPRMLSAGPAGDLRRSFSRLLIIFILVYALTTIAFFVTGRYRVPLLPLVITGAAVGAVGIWDAFRARRLRLAVAMVAAVIALTAVLSIDYFGVRRSTTGFAAYTDALDLLDTGKTDAAITRLEAIRREHSVTAPELYLTLARAYISRGRPEDGRSILAVAEDGLQRYPSEAELLWYSAVGHVALKEWVPARDRIERFLAEEPRDLKGLHLAFTIAIAQGRTNDARRFRTAAEAIDPASPLVEDMRATLSARQ